MALLRHRYLLCNEVNSSGVSRKAPSLLFSSSCPVLPEPSPFPFLLLLMTPLLKKPSPKLTNIGRLPLPGNFSSPLLLVQLQGDEGSSRGGLTLSQTRVDA